MPKYVSRVLVMHSAEHHEAPYPKSGSTVSWKDLWIEGSMLTSAVSPNTRGLQWWTPLPGLKNNRMVVLRSSAWLGTLTLAPALSYQPVLAVMLPQVLNEGIGPDHLLRFLFEN